MHVHTLTTDRENEHEIKQTPRVDLGLTHALELLRRTGLARGVATDN
jgi:hypothetical protein